MGLEEGLRAFAVLLFILGVEFLALEGGLQVAGVSAELGMRIFVGRGFSIFCGMVKILSFVFLKRVVFLFLFRLISVRRSQLNRLKTINQSNQFLDLGLSGLLILKQLSNGLDYAGLTFLMSYLCFPCANLKS